MTGSWIISPDTSGLMAISTSGWILPDAVTVCVTVRISTFAVSTVTPLERSPKKLRGYYPDNYDEDHSAAERDKESARSTFVLFGHEFLVVRAPRSLFEQGAPRVENADVVVNETLPEQKAERGSCPVSGCINECSAGLCQLDERTRTYIVALLLRCQRLLRGLKLLFRYVETLFVTRVIEVRLAHLKPDLVQQVIHFEPCVVDADTGTLDL